MNLHKKCPGKVLVGLLIWFASISLPVFAQELPDLCVYVNPFIGTGGHGHTYPGATVPFGMVQLSPDTFNHGWDWCSGYHWSDGSILGFSHTHLSGTGCGDLGDILFAPTTGAVNLVPGTREEPEKGYRSRFSHADEKASPGYYSVLLKTYDIKAELTATQRVGFHRYTFPKTKEANIIIDLVHGIDDKPIELKMDIVDDQTITGMRRSKGWAQDQYVFFAAKFSKPFKSYGTTEDETNPQRGTRSSHGTRTKGWITFDTEDGKPILAKVALSTANVEGALKNLSAEIPDWNFNGIKDKARATWKQELSKITVEGVPAVPGVPAVQGVPATPGAPAIPRPPAIPGVPTKDLETFYTALYHVFLAPTLISDVDGTYRGSDHEAHTANSSNIYSTFSLWDTFRAEQPLFTILIPKSVNDMIKSFHLQAEYHKDKTLPIWPLAANETYCMIGYHSFPVIAEAYAKGIRDWDAQAMLDLMQANTERNDWWADKGYIPQDKEAESVSKTLEFAYDDWSLSQFAKALGNTQAHDKFLKRSMAYRNLFDQTTGFMRPKLEDGSWLTPFDPSFIPEKRRDFTEGNAWQYTWFVPHDVQGLINLMGGRQAFIGKLDKFFQQTSSVQETKLQDMTGLIGQYAQGNEPSHHVAYLYSYAGAPSKTQDRVRTIVKELYGNTPEGLCGNEDCGQMSAWYIFSALGFYPVNPVEGTYVLGVPSFRKATIHLSNEHALTVVAEKLSPRCPYVEAVLLNGKPLKRVYLTHKEILEGGTLEFKMSPKSDSKWGTELNAAPPSISRGE
jgi:putative alpha-1,2-mannosidase